jgi:sarcosine oxidase subunit beta
MPDQSEFDVIVVGAGVIGCAIARALARDRSVLVVDSGEVAGGASGLAGASVSASNVLPEWPVLVGHINQWFRNYNATDEGSVTKSKQFSVVPSEQADATRTHVAEQAEQGYPVTFLDPDDLATRCPYVDLSEFGGAIQYGDFGWVDPLDYTTALKDDAEHRGAEVRTGVEVTTVLTDNGDVTGVDTDTGTIGGTNVVAAAGWKTEDLLTDRLSVPMRPYLTQGCEVDLGIAVDVETFPALELPVPSETGPNDKSEGAPLRIRPKQNGNVRVAGGHREYEPAEYDYEQASGGRRAETEFIETVMETLPRWFEDYNHIDVVNDWAGTGGGMLPDERPIIDAVDDLDGLFVATGFQLGFMLSPIAAVTMRSYVTNDRCPFPRHPFSLDRFD